MPKTYVVYTLSNVYRYVYILHISTHICVWLQKLWSQNSNSAIVLWLISLCLFLYQPSLHRSVHIFLDEQQCFEDWAVEVFYVLFSVKLILISKCQLFFVIYLIFFTGKKQDSGCYSVYLFSLSQTFRIFPSPVSLGKGKKKQNSELT